MAKVYPFCNDPKVIGRGVNIFDVHQAQGGFLPILDDLNYKSLKQQNNANYKYDDKVDHGKRPMHRTTFELNSSPKEERFLTSNKVVSNIRETERIQRRLYAYVGLVCECLMPFDLTSRIFKAFSYDPSTCRNK